MANKTTFDFGEQNNVGQAGERIFQQVYKDRINPVKSEEMAYDFNASCGKIELKTDTYPMEATGNFFFEHYSDSNTMKLGGPWRARQDMVDFFVYMYLNDRQFFWFDPTALANFLDSYIVGKKYKTIRNKAWTTIGYAVPREAVAHLYKQESYPDANQFPPNI